MYKLIFIDIDGTLLTSAHTISPGTLSAIKRVSEINKIPVILTTARPPQAVKDIYTQLNLKSPVVYYNGALIVATTSKTPSNVLFSSAMDARLAQQINTVAIQYNVSISFYKNEEWFCNTYDYWIKQEEEITKTKASVVNSALQIEKWITEKEGPHKILLIGEPAEINTIEPLLKKHTGDTLTMYKSKPSYLEIMNTGVSKKSAIVFLLKQNGLSREDILAIGDNYNDIEMLQFAGMGVAMRNAPDEVKANANFITSDNDSDGIKLALDKFIQ